MDNDNVAIAQSCLVAAYDGSLTFPEIVGKLAGAGFEGYSVDYRGGCQTYYLASGEGITRELSHGGSPIAATFDGTEVARLVHWAQKDGPDYSYAAFCEKVTAAGCAGYLVSFPGRRVVYYGRTAEVLTELFPE